MTMNPLTGRQEVSGDEASRDDGVVKQDGYRPTLLSDQVIFDQGLRSNEYHTFIRSLDNYTKDKYSDTDHIVYTIDSSSVEVSSEPKTFTFRLEEGKDSGEFIEATIVRPRFNNLDVTLQSDGQVVYSQTEKIDERL